MAQITRRVSPEEEELERKQAELAVLEAELAEKELDLATLTAELDAFEGKYLRMVGTRYAHLDRIEAEIGETLLRRSPHDPVHRRRAEEARAQADASRNAANWAGALPEREPFRPSEDLRRLYREAAKRFHPDLAEDDMDRERRTRVMKEINEAYRTGDREKLRRILLEWEASPDSIKGDDVGARLVRTIRKVARVRRRIVEIQAELDRLLHTDLYRLWRKAQEANEEGRNLLREMAQAADVRIKQALERLNEARTQRLSP